MKSQTVSNELKSPKKESNSANFMKHTKVSENKVRTNDPTSKPKSRGSIALENKMFGV